MIQFVILAVLSQFSTSEHVTCFNGHTTCAAGNICCQAWTNISVYYCCPEDKLCCHYSSCCPKEYKKTKYQTIMSENENPIIDRSNELLTEQTHELVLEYTPCTDSGRDCPHDTACCRKGCCPKGTTCGGDRVCRTKTSEGLPKNLETSVKPSFVTKLNKHASLMKYELMSIPCPGAGRSCPDQTTCCPGGCCLYHDAECCADGRHCCPSETTCDVRHKTCVSTLAKFYSMMGRKAQNSDYRIKISSAVKLSKSLMFTSQSRDIPCPGVSGSCPDGTTCCPGGCCLYHDAVCCSDGLHCCPSGTTCDVEQQKCITSKGEFTSILGIVSQNDPNYTAKPSLALRLSKSSSAVKAQSMDIPCAGGNCPDGTTCCPGGCCLYPDALCCSDGLHCCPSGTTCDVEHQKCITNGQFHSMLKNGATSSVINPKYLFNKRLNNSYPLSTSLATDVPCAGGSCPDNTTCCLDWCCGLLNAVCCPSGMMCCPLGTTCDEEHGMCVGSEGYSLTAVLKETSVTDHSTSKTSEAPMNSSVVYCPGGKVYCPDFNTCCLRPDFLWSCCPYPSGNCCPDGLHCCPAGSWCDITSKYCIS